MNNFAIEAVQSLFENMLNIPQSELETTVMRFREEVKNLESSLQGTEHNSAHRSATGTGKT